MKRAFHETLKTLREEQGLSQQELADGLQIKRSALGNYELGLRFPSPEVMEAIADFFNVDMDFLYGRSDIRNRYQQTHLKVTKPTPVAKKIPLLGAIAAGAPILADDHIEEYISLSVDVKADFALKVQGDSMIDANIHEGDIVFIHQQPSVENGEIAAVMLIDPDTSDAVATLKRVYKTPYGLQLVPENKNYAPIIVNEDNGEGAKILGKATYYITEAR